MALSRTHNKFVFVWGYRAQYVDYIIAILCIWIPTYRIDQRHSVGIFVNEFRASFRLRFIETARWTGFERAVINAHESLTLSGSTIGCNWQNIRQPFLVVAWRGGRIAFGHFATVKCFFLGEDKSALGICDQSTNSPILQTGRCEQIGHVVHREHDHRDQQQTIDPDVERPTRSDLLQNRIQIQIVFLRFIRSRHNSGSLIVPRSVLWLHHDLCVTMSSAQRSSTTKRTRSRRVRLRSAPEDRSTNRFALTTAVESMSVVTLCAVGNKPKTRRKNPTQIVVNSRHSTIHSPHTDVQYFNRWFTHSCYNINNITSQKQYNANSRSARAEKINKTKCVYTLMQSLFIAFYIYYNKRPHTDEATTRKQPQQIPIRIEEHKIP